MPSRPSTPVSPKQITILGAGAIGQLIFHQLAEANQQTASRLNFISKETDSAVTPLKFTTLDGQQITRHAKFVGLKDYAHELANTELLLVCVKAYQVKAALNSVLPYLSADAHILLLHNGMGPHLEVQPDLDSRSLSLGTTSQGAFRIDRYHVKQTGAGLTQLGAFIGAELSEELKTLLLSNIDRSTWHSDILPLLWQKLAINVAINPLTAIHDCPNGELAKIEYRDTIHKAVKELVEVAAADGLKLELALLIERVYQVIELTAQNFSSMHQDVYHQRQTEIDAINGFVLKRAQTHQISAPFNLRLVEQIKQLEAKYSY
ncbi:2-dehydropantoate 2-reductase [Shewanella schlegeliana]|uniref:2-dehydropantoate 2-reductase n=1 Tax=Shewanella schlegeliana TaxID=190308 RepID=A0ABS1T1F9_9GAMM|nr:2-dehydropantoate 2-reductase [Shewanella schlegeliana]MBL4913652.1 2-dehydropantoate 2-reductase [Shewanella schlegeliana]MCL1108543.1 2-dehydropantoate 2-reductase [Shewanella schlegeliana]GIU30970.1 2-dehydropantoate 2-reductase [Shewanella schlegeliana]